jgi:hypothetical protein
MKAHVATPGGNGSIPRTAEAVIFTHRPAQKDFLAVIQNAPWVKTILVSEVTYKTMGQNVKKLCEVMNITLIGKNCIWGKKEHLGGKLIDIDLKEEDKK